jgi:hypothetical protein
MKQHIILLFYVSSLVCLAMGSTALDPMTTTKAVSIVYNCVRSGRALRLVGIASAGKLARVCQKDTIKRSLTALSGSIQTHPRRLQRVGVRHPIVQVYWTNIRNGCANYVVFRMIPKFLMEEEYRPLWALLFLDLLSDYV